jgi:hypothetical protein
MGLLPLLLSEFHPEDIFNAFECGLFFSLLPHKRVPHGGKRGKHRITMLVCANMARSEMILLASNWKVSEGKVFQACEVPSMDRQT